MMQIIAMILLAVSVTAVNAADVYKPTTVLPEPTYYDEAPTWTGLWLGAYGGYQFNNAETDISFKDHNFLNIDGLGSDGYSGELGAGYDFQRGRFVFGAFTGIGVSDADFNASTPYDVGVNAEYDYEAVFGARLGVLNSDSTLFYVGGGAAIAEADFSAYDGPDSVSESRDLIGWFGQAGVESRVGDNLYLDFTGRYTDYGTETFDAGPIRIETDIESWNALVGLKYKLQ